MLKKIKSFLLDTADFLQALKEVGRVTGDCWLVMIDVTSLYTSIEHCKGIEAVHRLLEGSTYNPQQQDFMLQLLEIVLHENFFMFRDRFYMQKRGSAMGSNVAPHMQTAIWQTSRSGLFICTNYLISMPKYGGVSLMMCFAYGRGHWSRSLLSLNLLTPSGRNSNLQLHMVSF